VCNSAVSEFTQLPSSIRTLHLILIVPFSETVRDLRAFVQSHNPNAIVSIVDTFSPTFVTFDTNGTFLQTCLHVLKHLIIVPILQFYERAISDHTSTIECKLPALIVGCSLWNFCLAINISK
jgi:hypothetical protein